MEPTLLLCLISPMATFSTILVVLVYYLAGRQEGTDYEKEIRGLRQSLLQGQLDRKTFLYIKENLKVEDLYNMEKKRLHAMYEQNMMDSVTYDRMKKALEMTFNEKLVKIHKTTTADDSIPQIKN